MSRNKVKFLPFPLNVIVWPLVGVLLLAWVLRTWIAPALLYLLPWGVGVVVLAVVLGIFRLFNFYRRRRL